ANVPESMASRGFVKSMTFWLRSVMKYLDVYTAVSEAGADYFTNMIEDPITIVPNGVDLKKFSQAAADKKPLDVEEPTILFIGRLEGRKGVKHLLSAFQALVEDNHHAKLLIVGDGPEREKLELLAEDLKLANISFLGHVSEKRKLELLAEADLMVSPAIFGESFGIVLLEAMATNTVCIAGDNPGYEGVMQGIGALSLINPEDTKEFARRMHMLIHEKQLRTLWLNWSSRYVKQFDYPLVVKQYEKVYEDALKSHGHLRK
ncbi:MAG: glycosyltransferase family 4 protein, partial [Candidatus Saccharimonadales bacterium]